MQPHAALGPPCEEVSLILSAPPNPSTPPNLTRHATSLPRPTSSATSLSGHMTTTSAISHTYTIDIENMFIDRLAVSYGDN